MGVYWLRPGRFIVWGKRAEVPDASLKAGNKTSANEYALAA